MSQFPIDIASFGLGMSMTIVQFVMPSPQKYLHWGFYLALFMQYKRPPAVVAIVGGEEAFFLLFIGTIVLLTLALWRVGTGLRSVDDSDDGHQAET